MFDHLRKNRKKSIFYILRDVAQLVARVLWEQDTAPLLLDFEKRRKAL